MFLHRGCGRSSDERPITTDGVGTNATCCGIELLACHTATEEQARTLLAHNTLTLEPEEIVKEMLVHKLPDGLVVASMVAAIAMLQATRALQLHLDRRHSGPSSILTGCQRTALLVCRRLANSFHFTLNPFL
jgi:hypothetical protein